MRIKKGKRKRSRLMISFNYTSKENRSFRLYAKRILIGRLF